MVRWPGAPSRGPSMKEGTDEVGSCANCSPSYVLYLQRIVAKPLIITFTRTGCFRVGILGCERF